MSSFVSVTNKPSTGQKIKSNSMIYKSSSKAPIKDNPILIKMI